MVNYQCRAEKEDCTVFRGEKMETNTMLWLGWIFMVLPRYMDPHNESEFCAREKSDYWGHIDLYVEVLSTLLVTCCIQDSGQSFFMI